MKVFDVSCVMVPNDLLTINHAGPGIDPVLLEIETLRESAGVYLDKPRLIALRDALTQEIERIERLEMIEVLQEHASEADAINIADRVMTILKEGNGRG